MNRLALSADDTATGHEKITYSSKPGRASEILDQDILLLLQVVALMFVAEVLCGKLNMAESFENEGEGK